MIQRKFIPGSQWLYFKIYTGVKTADEVLAHTIRPFLRELYAERWIDGSFFIRYNDPDFHIRLRLHIDQFENLRTRGKRPAGSWHWHYWMIR